MSVLEGGILIGGAPQQSPGGTPASPIRAVQRAESLTFAALANVPSTGNPLELIPASADIGIPYPLDETVAEMLSIPDASMSQVVVLEEGIFDLNYKCSALTDGMDRAYPSLYVYHNDATIGTDAPLETIYTQYLRGQRVAGLPAGGTVSLVVPSDNYPLKFAAGYGGYFTGRTYDLAAGSLLRFDRFGSAPAPASESGPRVLRGQKIASLSIPDGTYTSLTTLGGWTTESSIPTGYSVATYTPFNQDETDSALLVVSLLEVSTSHIGFYAVLSEGAVEKRQAFIPLGADSSFGIALNGVDSAISMTMQFTAVTIGGITLEGFNVYTSRNFTLTATDNVAIDFYLAEN